jgi:hypothetical protein
MRQSDVLIMSDIYIFRSPKECNDKLFQLQQIEITQ